MRQPSAARSIASSPPAARPSIAAILQVMANVFGVDVYRLDVENSAALGAALRAYHADRLAAGEPISWQTAGERLHRSASPAIASRRIRSTSRCMRSYAATTRCSKRCTRTARPFADHCSAAFGRRGWAPKPEEPALIERRADVHARDFVEEAGL